jgi:hypothetical protein
MDCNGANGSGKWINSVYGIERSHFCCTGSKFADLVCFVVLYGTDRQKADKAGGVDRNAKGKKITIKNNPNYETKTYSWYSGYCGLYVASDGKFWQ